MKKKMYVVAFVLLVLAANFILEGLARDLGKDIAQSGGGGTTCNPVSGGVGGNGE